MDSDVLILSVIRAIFGLFLAALLGMVGFLAAWFIWDTREGSLTLFIAVLVTGSGVAAGIGGFLGWLKPDETWNIILIALALGLLGGIAGAWGGYAYGQQGEAALFSDASRVSTVLSAAVLANCLLLAANAYSAYRRR